MFFKIIMAALNTGATFLYGSTGEIIIEKGGHLNLGIPGVMSLGAAAGCLTVYHLMKNGQIVANSPWLLVLLPLIVTILTGALLGVLYSFLTVTLRANQNVVGLSLTTFGVGLSSFIMRGLPKLPDGTNGIFSIAGATDYYHNLFNVSAGANEFVKILFSHGILVYLALIIAIVAQIVLSKTRVGLNLRAVGENPATADAAGINVTKYKYVSTCIGCAIAAIGGLFCIMDSANGNWDDNIISTYGWLSVALVIFTLWRPALSIGGSFVFAIFYSMTSYVNVSTESGYTYIIQMVPYIVTVLVLVITSIINRKSTNAPAALGVPYFREER